MKFTSYYSGSKGNLYSVESQGQVLLIDPGVSYPRINTAVDLRNVCGALVSHSHMDHCKAVPKLLERGIYCYASVQTIKAIGQRLRFMSVLSNSPYDIGPFLVKPFDVKHDAPGTLGFLIVDGYDKLLYVTDTPYIQPQFKNLTIIAIECNYSDETFVDVNPSLEGRIRNNHTSLRDVLQFLKNCDISTVREIHLLHLSERNSHAQNFRDAVEIQTGKSVFVA